MRNSPEQDSEIDLRVYIEVIAKRKAWILSAFVVAVVLAIAWIFLGPRIHEVSMVIEPPQTGNPDVDSAAGLEAKIEEGVFNTQIDRELMFPNEESGFEVSHAKDTNLLQVSLKLPTNETDSGLRYLTELAQAIRMSYAQSVDEKRTAFAVQIKAAASHVGAEISEIKLRQKQLEILAARQKGFNQFLAQIKTAPLENVAISSGFYMAALQENASYFSLLPVLISSATDNLIELRKEKGNLELSKNNIQNITVVQEPVVSPQPIPIDRHEIKTIFMAGLVGVIFGLFVVFAVPQ